MAAMLREDARPGERITVRVCSLQLEPAHADPAASMAKADRLLSHLSAADRIGLLMLPEMAFTGYLFRDRAAIAPLCERAGAGATFAWCAATARRLRCTVCCGFPRRRSAAEAAAEAAAARNAGNGRGECAKARR